jgi:hypothetical protein
MNNDKSFYGQKIKPSLKKKRKNMNWVPVVGGVCIMLSGGILFAVGLQYSSGLMYAGIVLLVVGFLVIVGYLAFLKFDTHQSTTIQPVIFGGSTGYRPQSYIPHTISVIRQQSGTTTMRDTTNGPGTTLGIDVSGKPLYAAPYYNDKGIMEALNSIQHSKPDLTIDQAMEQYMEKLENEERQQIRNSYTDYFKWLDGRENSNERYIEPFIQISPGHKTLQDYKTEPQLVRNVEAYHHNLTRVKQRNISYDKAFEDYLKMRGYSVSATKPQTNGSKPMLLRKGTKLLNQAPYNNDSGLMKELESIQKSNNGLTIDQAMGQYMKNLEDEGKREQLIDMHKTYFKWFNQRRNEREMFFDNGQLQWSPDENPYIQPLLLRNAQVLYHNARLLDGDKRDFHAYFDEYLHKKNISTVGYEWPEEFDNFEGFPTHT